MTVSTLGRWAVEQALPLWGSAGFDEREGQFVECLARDGRPLADIPRRVMVQARQIYVFALAHERGWFPDGGRLADIAYRQLVIRYGDGGGRGWAFSADRSGRILDSTRDLYAQAFVLLALAAIRRLTGGEEPLRLARETVAFLDGRMRSPAGGYVEALPCRSAPRRQNPHMHLLEACLAWHAIAPGEGFDRRACEILELLDRRFVARCACGMALVESFDEALVPLGGPDYAFEPGHHFEWVWLLAEAGRLTGKSRSELAAALWASALRYGFGSDGALFDEVAISGLVLKRSIRLWPLTEALKACCSGLPVPAGARACEPDALAETLLSRFLRPAHPGAWLDHFDADGRAMRSDVPASSLYHLCCALSQY